MHAKFDIGCSCDLLLQRYLHALNSNIIYILNYIKNIYLIINNPFCSINSVVSFNVNRISITILQYQRYQRFLRHQYLCGICSSCSLSFMIRHRFDKIFNPHVLSALYYSQLVTRVAGGPATCQFPPVSISRACCDVITSQHAME